ncbi:carbohydrate ABC transporter permease [Alloscardovia macacae]|uniref:Sugar ABC transporter permease n=1 Tax=Alloscardovia macacae TaxID=1160091 RepID=A0A261F690_9BIFI|nr:carbohydrate ABC transporter permease [Alloscardovia macacae]OZG54657.1 sugar ABC transporter permease [Alloscardovia macacae]
MTTRTKNGMGTPALEQIYGKNVARTAKRARAKLVMTNGEKRAGWGSYLVLSIALLAFLFPLYYAVSIASQNSTDTQYGVRSLIPGTGLMKNLALAFEDINFWQALGGTTIVTLTVSVSTVFFSTLAGFAFAKLRFKGRNLLLTLVVATMTIPQQLTVVPMYIMTTKVGLYGSLLAVIIPGLVGAFGVFWMTQYLEDALPYELIEAGRVDGASMGRIFVSIALPAAKPAASMLFLFTFIGSWTSYFWPMLILGPNKNSMLTVAASALKGAHFTDYTLIMSGVILTAIPLLVVFVFTGRQLVSGIMAGAVKG